MLSPVHLLKTVWQHGRFGVCICVCVCVCVCVCDQLCSYADVVAIAAVVAAATGDRCRIVTRRSKATTPAGTLGFTCTCKAAALCRHSALSVICELQRQLYRLESKQTGALNDVTKDVRVAD